MKVKEESEKVGLKFNIQKTKIMVSCPITSWQIDEETMETVRDFILGGAPKSLQIVTAAMKLRRLILGRKAMTNLDNLLRSRDITLPPKVHLVKAIAFLLSHVWMWELDYKESWVPKNWCFWTVVLEKTLESSLDCKQIQPVNPKGNQSWMFRTDWKDWCWSWNSNTLTTWCEEPTHWKRLWCWERLMMEGEGDNRGWHGWMASPTQWTWVWVGFRSCWWTGRPGVLQSMWLQRVIHDWATELNWTEAFINILSCTFN